MESQFHYYGSSDSVGSRPLASRAPPSSVAEASLHERRNELMLAFCDVSRLRKGGAGRPAAAVGRLWAQRRDTQRASHSAPSGVGTSEEDSTGVETDTPQFGTFSSAVLEDMYVAYRTSDPVPTLGFFALIGMLLAAAYFSIGRSIGAFWAYTAAIAALGGVALFVLVAAWARLRSTSVLSALRSASPDEGAVSVTTMRSSAAWRARGGHASHNKRSDVTSVGSLDGINAALGKWLHRATEVIVGTMTSVILAALLAVSLYNKAYCGGAVDDAALRLCYQSYSVESFLLLGMFVFPALGGVRVPYSILCCVLCVVSFVAMSLLGPFRNTTVANERFFASLIMFSVGTVACVFYAGRYERSQRRLFLWRLRLELQAETLRDMAVVTSEAASFRIPDHVLVLLQQSAPLDGVGVIDIRCGVVCVMALAGFAGWEAVRGPCDVVNSLAAIVASFEGAALQPPAHGGWAVTRSTSLGDTCVYVFTEVFGGGGGGGGEGLGRQTPSSGSTGSPPLWQRSVGEYVANGIRRSVERCNELNEKERRLVSAGFVAATPPLIPVFGVSLGLLRLLVVTSAAAVHARGPAVEKCLQGVSSLRCKQTDVLTAAAASGPMPGGCGAVVFTCDGGGDLLRPTASASKAPLKNRQRADATRLAGGDGLKPDKAASSSAPASASSPLGSIVFGGMEEVYELRRAVPGLSTQAFLVESTEIAFRRDVMARAVAEGAVTVSAAFMTLFSLALFATIALYDLWSWTWMAPLPYAILSLLVSCILLIRCHVHSSGGPCVSVGEWELLHMLFAVCFLMAPLVSQDTATIIGARIAPWGVCVLLISFMRPPHSAPVWRFASDLPFAMGLAVRGYVMGRPLDLGYCAATVVGCYVAHVLFDNAAASQFAASCHVELQHVALREITDRAKTLLEGLAPNDAAHEMLLHRLQSAAPRRRVKVKLTRSCRIAQRLRSTVLSTSIEDRAIALIDIMSGVEGHRVEDTLTHNHRHRSTVGINAPRMPTPDIIHEVLVAMNAPPRSLGSTIRVSLGKLSGDCVMLSSFDDSGHGADPALPLAALIQTVFAIAARMGFDGGGCDAHHLSGEVTPTCETNSVRATWRAWMTWCPTVGALIGVRCPIFEWYGPFLASGLVLTQLRPEKGGPLEWGMLIATSSAAARLEGSRSLLPAVADVTTRLGGAMRWRVAGVGLYIPPVCRVAPPTQSTSSPKIVGVHSNSEKTREKTRIARVKKPLSSK